VIEAGRTSHPNVKGMIRSGLLYMVAAVLIAVEATPKTPSAAGHWVAADRLKEVPGAPETPRLAIGRELTAMAPGMVKLVSVRNPLSSKSTVLLSPMIPNRRSEVTVEQMTSAPALSLDAEEESAAVAWTARRRAGMLAGEPDACPRLVTTSANDSANECASGMHGDMPTAASCKHAASPSTRGDVSVAGIFPPTPEASAVASLTGRKSALRRGRNATAGASTCTNTPVELLTMSGTEVLGRIIVHVTPSSTVSPKGTAERPTSGKVKSYATPGVPEVGWST
jgi:hypothetical protein